MESAACTRIISFIDTSLLFAGAVFNAKGISNLVNLGVLADFAGFAIVKECVKGSSIGLFAAEVIDIYFGDCRKSGSWLAALN